MLSHATDRSISLTTALRQALTDVRELHTDQCDLTNPNSPSATVVLFRSNDEIVETLVLADSTLVVSHESGHITALTDNRLQQLKDRLTSQGQAPPSGAAMSEYRNQPGGFWVAGAQPSAASEALTETWPLESVAAAALLTDGAARHVDLFAKASWPQAMHQLAQRQPEKILAQVRQTEDSDPNRTKWKRSKVHDDATIAYVRR